MDDWDHFIRYLQKKIHHHLRGIHNGAVLYAIQILVHMQYSK